MHRCPDIRSEDAANHPEWLNVIHAVNEARPGTFLEPDSVGPNASGNYIEDYPEARVVFPPEAERFTPGAVVQVIGKTPDVEHAIRAAARKLGYTSL